MRYNSSMKTYTKIHLFLTLLLSSYLSYAATLTSLTLTVDTTSLNKDANTTIEVEAVYSDNTTKDVTDTVTWLIDHPSAVQIQSHTLTAKQNTNTTLRAKLGDQTSNAITLELYWEVNGHRLPPEPDPAVNNATLLGVDVNANGVRDDVERKVYATYHKAIEQAVMMQAFKTKQAMLADPDLVKNAREWEEKFHRPLNCNRYLHLYKNYPRIKNISKTTSNWQFNTEERVKKYFKYDRALSGGVFSLGNPISNDCKFDVEKILEMDR